MEIKVGDWVILKESVSGKWSRRNVKMGKGARGKVLKETDNNKVNVLFGTNEGIIEVNKEKLELS